MNEKKIIECIKAKQYENSLPFFLKIFDSINKAKNTEFFEIKYNDIKVILIELIIKLAIIFYKDKNLKYYISLLEKLKNQINHKEIESKVDELLLELAIIQIEEEDEQLFDYVKSTLLDEKSSEIKQRLNLYLIVLNYLSQCPKDALIILLKPTINLSYLTRESFEACKNYFKETITLNELFLISKIFYKIIVSSGLFNEVDCLNIIGVKILELYRIPNIQEEAKFNDIIEYLIISFQEIMMNNKKIQKYDNYKNILFKVIMKDNKYINCITRGLLFLSKKKIIFEKKILDILKAYLLKNEDGNILELLFIQSELQPQIFLENLEFIYKILLIYQKNKFSGPNIDKIFNFLISLPEDNISSKSSIINLEKYLNGMNINPLCYQLIKKIPIEKRGIILSQKLSNFNDKEFGIIQMNKNQFKTQLNFKVSITKEELKQIENKLDDQEIAEKLVLFLKRQKELPCYPF